jgi:hypothetical protein
VIKNRYLEEYTQLDEAKQERKEAIKRLLNFAAKHPIERGERRWMREMLY